jgi:Trypsin-like peptidase domain
MFADAVENAAKFTRALVAICACVDGECRPSVGSFVVINRDGWIITACHIHQMLVNIGVATAATKDHLAKVEAVQANHGLSKHDRKATLKRLGTPKPEAPIAHAFWWAKDNLKLLDISLLPEADLMVGRLEPFDPAWVPTYPAFKDPNTPIRQGTSLCRFGYPFTSIKADYDAAANRFTWKELSLPGFPIEGIVTRTLEIGPNPAGYRNRFIETSSPGLKGQSGGPIIDRAGTIWGIQSRTSHLSLGFDPDVLDETGKKTNRKEHQFLNVGWAAHPETVAGFLQEKNIQHQLVP